MIDKEDNYNLTIQQENIWLIEKLYENTNVNNITGIFYINKILDVNILEKVLNKIIENNDALRIKIAEDKGHPFQYVCKYEFEKMPIYITKNKKEVNEIVNRIKLEKINIINNKLYHMTIIQDDTTTYVCVKMHHIISDAWTLGQVAEQIKENYVAIMQQEKIIEKPSYILHIEKDEEYRKTEKYLKDREFWKAYVKDLNIENNFETPKFIESKRIEKRITNNLFFKIQDYCKKNKITEYSLFLSIISIYFMKQFGRDSIVIGTPFLNRSKRDKELEMMGMFISTLPIKVNIEDENKYFIDLCKEIESVNMSCFRHSKYPYYEIQKEYQKQSQTANNLYEIAFSYQINQLEKQIDGDIGKTVWLHNNSQSNPILISYVNHFGEHKLYYDYLTQIFKREEINQINDRIMDMINTVIQGEKLKVSELSILSKKDIQLLKQFNSTGNQKNNEDTIISRFNNIVEKNKDKIAIKCGEESITYADLNKKTDDVANNLKKYGITKNIPVSIIFDKGINMIIAMLGIMKAGGYYIPILPEEEKKRAEYIVQNSDSKIVITESQYVNKIAKDNIKVININELINETNNFRINESAADNIAYLIYTSGTTGVPKGVIMQHKNIISLINSINKDKELKFIKDDISISLLKYSFDASAIDIYTSLLNGGTLILVPKEIELNPKAVVEIIDKENVTRCFTVHKWIEQIQNYGLNRNIKLRVLGTGAETLKPERFKKLLKKNKALGLYNTYGPTEATMFVTKHKVKSKDIKDNYAPIGGLIPHARAIVMNNNQVVPINVKGELVIYEDEKSSQNISKGYYKLDNETNKKYIKINLPYKNKSVRAYKTGDIVKINNNLELEFFGRKDDFVKVNGGYLVSLNEVEKTIQRVCGNNLEICAISTKIKNVNEIAVFVVKKGDCKHLKTEDIKQVINENLTFYMRPQYIIEINEIPINKNGKTDKNRLNEFINQNYKHKKESIKPSNELEKLIYNKIQKMIGQEFSVVDDFEDDLGLDSLNITSLYAELENEKLSIQDLYNYSSVRALANMIKTENKTEDHEEENIKIYNKSKKLDLSNVFLTGVTGFLGANLLKELAYNEATKKIYCLIRSKLNKTSTQRFKEIIHNYFDKEDCEKISEKAIVVNGDLTKTKLGIDDKYFINIMNETTTIINSAANVKHIGKYKDFYRDNVITVKQLIDICDEYKISLAHVSTLSLNGFRTNNLNEELVFDEDKLNIGQSFNKSPYLISKYEAEKNVLKAINEKNINAKIFRVGNIMPRSSDGMFQINYKQNAFMLAIKEILKLEIKDEKIINEDFYLTPVDECSRAILKILNSNNPKNIYHIESDKPIRLTQILQIVEKEIKTSSINIEYNIGIEHLKEISEKHSCKYTKTKTIKILKDEGFEWLKLDEKYLENIINIVQKIKQGE